MQPGHPRSLVDRTPLGDIESRGTQPSSGQSRHTKRRRKLPANFRVDGQQFPRAAGTVSFRRLGSAQGAINILGQLVSLIIPLATFFSWR